MPKNIYEFLKLIKNKLGFNELPMFNKEHYVYKEKYKLEEVYEVDVYEDTKIIDDVYIYGWVLESRYLKGEMEHRRWWPHWNHKVYNNKSIALDAITQFKIPSGRPALDYEFRVVPLYSFKNNGHRTYIINKIIENND